MTQKVIKLIKHRQESRTVLVAPRSVLGRSNFGCNYSFWGMQGIYQLCTSGSFLRGWVNTYCMQVSVGAPFRLLVVARILLATCRPPSTPSINVKRSPLRYFSDPSVCLCPAEGWPLYTKDLIHFSPQKLWRPSGVREHP